MIDSKIHPKGIIILFFIYPKVKELYAYTIVHIIALHNLIILNVSWKNRVFDRIYPKNFRNTSNFVIEDLNKIEIKK